MGFKKIKMGSLTQNNELYFNVNFYVEGLFSFGLEDIVLEERSRRLWVPS